MLHELQWRLLPLFSRATMLYTALDEQTAIVPVSRLRTTAQHRDDVSIAIYAPLAGRQVEVQGLFLSATAVFSGQPFSNGWPLDRSFRGSSKSWADHFSFRDTRRRQLHAYIQERSRSTTHTYELQWEVFNTGSTPRRQCRALKRAGRGRRCEAEMQGSQKSRSTTAVHRQRGFV